MSDSRTVEVNQIASFCEIDVSECKRLAKSGVMKRDGSKFYFLESVQGYIRHQKQQNDETFKNRTELAEWLSLTSRQISNLRAKGVLVSNTEGTEETEYHLKDSVVAYVEHLRDRKGWLSEKEKGQRLENELKEEQLAKARGEVYDRATIDRDFTTYAAEIVKLHKSFTTHLKKRNPNVAQRVWDAIDERLATIRQAAKEIRISNEAITGDAED